MPIFEYDKLRFHYRQAGEGLAFFFQHGLTADVNQPFGLFVPPPGVRMITMDCRAHGLTDPVGDPEKISLEASADDLAALMDHLEIDRAVIGGISMGAAITLNFALRHSTRAMGLVVSRPAWLDGPLPANVELYTLIAGLIRRHGAREARQVFAASARYKEIVAESPDVAASLLRHFELPKIEERIDLLERIPQDRPYRKLSELAAIRVPTLVLANRQDPVHPFEFGEAIAEAIPTAEFRELTAKSVSRDQHTADVQRHIEGFLTKHFLTAAASNSQRERNEIVD